MMRVVFQVSLPAIVKKEERYYVSICPILDVCSQGPTKKKALDNLKEAVQLFIESCFERGTLDKVLHECGLRPAPLKPPASHRRTSAKPQQMIHVNMPFNAPMKAKAVCHA